jgi:DNA-binding CsgD family transcriptional regulator
MTHRRALVRLCVETVERLVRQGKTDAEAAALLGCSVRAVAGCRQRIGIFRANNHNPRRLQRGDVLPLWLAGASLQQIADEIGCTVATLKRNVDRLDLPSREYVGNRWRLVGAPAQPTAQPAPTDLTGRLLATKGRWAELAKVADKHGLTMAQVQQRYHKARTG